MLISMVQEKPGIEEQISYLTMNTLRSPRKCRHDAESEEENEMKVLGLHNGT